MGEATEITKNQTQITGTVTVTSDDMARAIREPVSYTHLRAHETVLDLVCRLLLENKNLLHI